MYWKGKDAWKTIGMFVEATNVSAVPSKKQRQTFYTKRV